MLKESSSLAIHTNRDIPTIQQSLLKSWELFLKGEQITENVRPEVYQSWKRCQLYDVNPLQLRAPDILDDDDLKSIIEQSELYSTSLPMIEHLNKQITGTEHIITLSDKYGKIIHLEGDKSILKEAEKMNFTIGADWSEEKAGSNAIGTSLAIGKPVQIFSFEHFCQGVHPWICSAAPIRDPITKDILGVIDLTGPSELAQSHSLTVVQSISKLIESQLFKNAQNIYELLLSRYEQLKHKNQFKTILILNKNGKIIKGDKACLHFFKCKNWQQFIQHKQFNNLKKLLKEMEDIEFEWYPNSIPIKLHIKKILNKTRLIGYEIVFEQISSQKKQQIKPNFLHHNIISQSSAMEQIITKINIIANTSVSVLITGESGTGKEVLASLIHKQSNRKNGPFITINCGAIPKHLIASELFGYEPGAFTGGNPKGKKGKFEEASGGTILLDEIGEMPIDLQVHLLRVLEEKEVVRLGATKPIPLDLRIIAATNQNIQKLIKANKFREDLYYRLNVVELSLPALRERKEDIPLLSNYFANKFAKKHKKPIPAISEEVLNLFHSYDWSGNIRELRNIIEFAVLFNKHNVITTQSLPKPFLLRSKRKKIKRNIDYFNPLEIEEKEKIKNLLVETKGNISEVARRCGIARSTLYRKLKKYNLQ